MEPFRVTQRKHALLVSSIEEARAFAEVGIFNTTDLIQWASYMLQNGYYTPALDQLDALELGQTGEAHSLFNEALAQLDISTQTPLETCRVAAGAIIHQIAEETLPGHYGAEILCFYFTPHSPQRGWACDYVEDLELGKFMWLADEFYHDPNDLRQFYGEMDPYIAIEQEIVSLARQWLTNHM